MRVTGTVNDQPVEFDPRGPGQYEAETGRAKDGAYRTRIVAEDEYGNVSVSRDTTYTDDAWIEPVWWRTAQDVDRVRQLNKKVAVSGLAALTADEQTEWLSGMPGSLNDWDLNRIETDTRWLCDKLYACGYGLGRLDHKTDWATTDYPSAPQFERIRANVETLLNIYHRQKAELPETLEKPDWKAVNALERILYEMRDMIRLMEESYRYCGTFHSGQEVVF